MGRRVDLRLQPRRRRPARRLLSLVPPRRGAHLRPRRSSDLLQDLHSGRLREFVSIPARIARPSLEIAAGTRLAFAPSVTNGGIDMRTTNGKLHLDLEFRDAVRSRPIVECLERSFVVTRMRSNG